MPRMSNPGTKSREEMMNLEDACAAYFIERDSLLDELHPDAKDYPDTSISWHRELDRLALDEAVRDVAIAAVERTRIIQERRMTRAQREVVVAELDKYLEVKA